MGDVEVQDLKDDVKEIKGDVKEVSKSLSALQILIAENYVTRQEFDEYKKEEKSNKRWWAGFIISAAGVIMTAIMALSSWFGRGK